jgi:hypothetical protein
MVPVLRQTSHFHTFTSYFRSILILFSHALLGLPNDLFLQVFVSELTQFSSPSRVPHMPCISNCPWFDHSNNIWRGVQITKLLIMQFFPSYFMESAQKYIKPTKTKKLLKEKLLFFKTKQHKCASDNFSCL